MMDVVCAVIEDESGRFLACLRPPGKHLAGRWEFPGGKVDPGESPEVALVREMREELGVEVAVGLPLDPVIWNYDRGSIRLIPFRCVITGGHLQAIEHEQVVWCAPEDFKILPWAEADLPILEQILAGISREIEISTIQANGPAASG
jgi:8-oxo-dGTP diphosphatase